MQRFADSDAEPLTPPLPTVQLVTRHADVGQARARKSFQPTFAFQTGKPLVDLSSVVSANLADRILPPPATDHIDQSPSSLQCPSTLSTGALERFIQKVAVADPPCLLAEAVRTKVQKRATMKALNTPLHRSLYRNTVMAPLLPLGNDTYSVFVSRQKPTIHPPIAVQTGETIPDLSLFEVVSVAPPLCPLPHFQHQSLHQCSEWNTEMTTRMTNVQERNKELAMTVNESHGTLAQTECHVKGQLHHELSVQFFVNANAKNKLPSSWENMTVEAVLHRITRVNLSKLNNDEGVEDRNIN